MTDIKKQCSLERAQVLAEYSIIIGISGLALLGLIAPVFPTAEGPRSILGLFVGAYDVYISSIQSVIGAPIP